MMIKFKEHPNGTTIDVFLDERPLGLIRKRNELGNPVSIIWTYEVINSLPNNGFLFAGRLWFLKEKIKQ